MSEGGYIYHFPRVMLRKDKTNPRRIAYLLLLLFAVPPSWPVMAIGTVLVVAGVAFHGWAAGYLARAGYDDRETVLTLLGPYRHNRNPYYVAHLVMDLGFFVVAGLAPFALIYLPLLFLVYRRWVLNEEPFLRQEFGEEYEQMCREVPRWGIRLTPAPKRGPDQPFTWSMYWFNGEQWRTGSHLLVLGIFWLYWLYGNPFAAWPTLANASLAAAVTVYYLVHDVRPRDVSRLSRGWLVAGVVIAASGGALLGQASVWIPWSGPWSGLGIGAGILLAAVLVAGAWTGKGAEGAKGPFAVTLVPWYLLLLALGLISGTFAGVWLALAVTLTVWALVIAGAISVPDLPRRPATAVGIAGVAGVAAVASALLG
ncbi:methyltransferase family protein [Thiohalorhabdus sp.]|uniref:methyltransferase family protein n=1 Tax=Thiohalorhabdus sp. TaxID=3094134 RepID=UPI002FC332A1